MASLYTTGTKGSDVYTAAGLGNSLLELSNLLIRDTDSSYIQEGFDKVMSSSYNNQRVIEDLIVLAFHTRDITGGKGERKCSEDLFKCLLRSEHTRAVTLDLLDLIPEYGSWRDLFKLGIPVCGTRLLDIVEKQFTEDELACSAGLPMSLLAKWMPREGQIDVTPFVARLVPGKMFMPTRMKTYRKRLARLNKALDTVEIKMCAKNWQTIDPKKVPGRALHKYTQAFLNEKNHAPRYPDNVDRLVCRASFQEYFKKSVLGELKAKSATLYPHEVVKKAMNIIKRVNPEEFSQDEVNRLEGTWKSMVNDARQGGGLGRSLAMCDFSGSMSNSRANKDLPYWVSLSMGLLISEITKHEFKDTFLTFDSTPKFHIMPKGSSLFEKLSTINSSISQGLSTDFQAAMDLVLKVLKVARTVPGNEPENLIVLTDMAWDAACGSSDTGAYTGNRYRHINKTAEWQTHVEMIREAFKRAGEDMWGVCNGWKMPRIVIWNISAGSKDFHATAETEGVVMLSGWSPNMFKILQKEGVVIKTPLDALRLQLDDERYRAVRDRVSKFFNSEAARKEWFRSAYA